MMDDKFKFEIACLNCGKQLKCSFNAVGKKVRCPKCNELMIATPFEGDKGARSVPVDETVPIVSQPEVVEEPIAVEPQNEEEPLLLPTRTKTTNPKPSKSKKWQELFAVSNQVSNSSLDEATVQRVMRLRYARRAKFFAELTGVLTIACTIISVWFYSQARLSYEVGFLIGAVIGSCFFVLLITHAVGLLADISASLNDYKK